ncbi:hypothetical protein V2W30_25355 [Streptomyces sp. Q6]|uniref:Uncharacterized protein n=1 Tax=Streptomyces citrinus TaxID=3118173 RepID=A0ACD5AKI0_9ACTN
MADCERADAAAPAAVTPVGEVPGRLLQDAARRVLAIGELPYPVSPDRERPAPAPGADRAAGLTAPRRELLTHADGRRTARDLAFRTGRGVYAVTVEVARMLAEGLLECAPASAPVRLPGVRPGMVRRRLRALPAPLEEPDDLPRRSPGASGINEILNAHPSQAS